MLKSTLEIANARVKAVYPQTNGNKTEKPILKKQKFKKKPMKLIRLKMSAVQILDGSKVFEFLI